MDLPRLHRGDQPCAPLGTGLTQVAVDGPKHLAVPLEPRAFGIAGRALADLQRFVQVLVLELLDLGLYLREADVHV